MSDEKAQCGNCGRWFWPKYLRPIEVTTRGLLKLCALCRGKLTR